MVGWCVFAHARASNNFRRCLLCISTWNLGEDPFSFADSSLSRSYPDYRHFSLWEAFINCMDPQYNCKVVLSECVSSYNSVQLKKQRSKLKIERCKMQAESDESRQVIDDIDLFRMQLSYDDGDQPQLAPTLSSNSSNYGSTNSSNYGYRSRDEVANAILTLRGKEKQAEYIKAQGAPFQHSTRSVVKISKEAKELAAIANEPTYTITQAKETMKTEGLLVSIGPLDYFFTSQSATLANLTALVVKCIHTHHRNLSTVVHFVPAKLSQISQLWEM